MRTFGLVVIAALAIMFFEVGCAETLEDAEPPTASRCDELNPKRLCQSLFGADVAQPRPGHRVSA